MKNRFSQFVPAVMAILGIKDWNQDADKKNALLAEEKEKLKNMGFNDTFLTGFCEALSNDFPDDKSEGSKEKETGIPEGNASNAVIQGLLADITAKLATAQEEIVALTKDKGELSTEVAAKRTEITGLNEKIKTLSNMGEPDKGIGAQHAAIIPDAKDIVLNWDDDKQLGGITGEMYGMDRAYNQRLRAEMLYRKGIAVQVPTASSIDYSRLKEDLGAFYRVPWQDRLQSFLMLLPSIESIFPLESGYQDLAVLTNIWLGEFSQADNTESDFENVTKGSYEFDNETLRMYSVMFAHKFRDLKAIEKSWIGSYNKEGSQVIKWSFIEYILAETAKKLHNEREQRRVNGVRKEPDINKPGRAMGASDGIYEFINKKVNGHIDINNGKLVYQVKPFELGVLTQENIGEKLFQGTAMIPAVLRDSGSLSLYIPSHMIVWYHKYNELHYGLNQDYKAGMMYVKEYPAVRLIPVPNADNHHRIIWTMTGNIHTFEHVPGEMTKFSIEQQDWTLKVWSNWKESIWAYAVGYKYLKKEDMDYSRQMIFCNEYDRPASYFLESEKDAQPSAKYHTSIVTVANTNLLDITNVEDAEVGQVITLKCGSENKGVKINKTGNFSLLTEAWNPKKGDLIRVMKRADGKFIEIARETGATDALQFDDNETMPSLQSGSVFVTGANTVPTAIAGFADAITGKTYTIYGNGSANASTIANSGSFVLTAAMTLTAGKFIKLVKADDGKFYEVARG